MQQLGIFSFRKGKITRILDHILQGYKNDNQVIDDMEVVNEGRNEDVAAHLAMIEDPFHASNEGSICSIESSATRSEIIENLDVGMVADGNTTTNIIHDEDGMTINSSSLVDSEDCHEVVQAHNPNNFSLV